MNAKNVVLNMVFSALVNNEQLLSEVIKDVQARFKTTLDKKNLANYLNVVEINTDNTTIYTS
jgi:hypothetical protein